MRVKQLAIRSVVFNWFGRFCAIAITFILTPILIHGLGKESYGLWSIVMSLTSYTALLDLGFRSATTKYIAQYDGMQDHASVNAVVSSSIILFGFLGLLVFPATFGMAYGASKMFIVAGESVASIRLAILLTGVKVAIGIWGQVFAAILAARARFDVIMSLNIASKLLGAILMIVVIRLGGGLVGMAVVTLVVSLCIQVTQYVLAIRQLPSMTLSRFSFDLSMLKTLGNFTLLNFFVRVMRQLPNYATPLIVGVVLGPVMVTYYSIADALVKHVRKFSKGVAQVVMPVTSHLESQKRHEALTEILVVAPRVLLPLALGLTIVFFLLGQALIDIWIGKGFSRHVVPVLRMLMIGQIFRMATNPLHAMMVGMNRLKFLSMTATIEGLIVLGAGIMLTHLHGLVGMAGAIVLAQCITSGVLLPIYACREVGHSVLRFSGKVVCPAVLAALPALTVAVLIARFFPVKHLIELLSLILCMGTVIVISTFFICLNHDMRSNILRALWLKRRERVKRRQKAHDGVHSMSHKDSPTEPRAGTHEGAEHAPFLNDGISTVTSESRPGL